MPLPAALLERLKKRGILNQEGKKVFVLHKLNLDLKELPKFFTIKNIYSSKDQIRALIGLLENFHLCLQIYFLSMPPI